MSAAVAEAINGDSRMNRRQLIARTIGSLGAAWSLGLPSMAIAKSRARKAPPFSTAARERFMERYMRRPGRKNVLAWAPIKNGFQHNSISHAIAVMEEIGYASQIYDTYIHTDSEPITLDGMIGSYGQKVFGRDLTNYDAIFCLGVREVYLTAQQRADLLEFIRNGGGFVGVHAASTMFLPWPPFDRQPDREEHCDRAFKRWPEFNRMLGGTFDGHPFGVIDAPIIVDDPLFPATRFLPAKFNLRDEMYQFKNWSRNEMDVVLRLDTTHLNLHHRGVHDHTPDWPLAWAKTYGKGRIFYCALGHARTTWDIPDVQRIYFEGLKWALRLEDADVSPHPMRQVAGPTAELAAPPPPCGPSWVLPKRGTAA